MKNFNQLLGVTPLSPQEVIESAPENTAVCEVSPLEILEQLAAALGIKL